MPIPKRTAASAFGVPTNIINPDSARIGSPTFLNIFLNISSLPGGLTPVALQYIGCRAHTPVASCKKIHDAVVFRQFFAYIACSHGGGKLDKTEQEASHEGWSPLTARWPTDSLHLFGAACCSSRRYMRGTSSRRCRINHRGSFAASQNREDCEDGHGGLSGSPRPTLKGNHPPRRRFLKNPIVVVLAVLGSIIAAFELAGVFTMTLAYWVLILGVPVFVTAEAWFSGWLQRTKRYRFIVLSLIGCACSVFAISVASNIKAARLQQQWEYSTITFKSSTALSTKRQEKIRMDLCAFRVYMEGLGFEVKDMPPIAIVTGKGNTMTWNAQGPAYLSTIGIELSNIDDPPMTTSSYSQYVIQRFLVSNASAPNRDLATALRSIFDVFVYEDTFATYFNWSFWGQQTRRPGNDSLLQSLWRLRTSLGVADFDKLMFLTVQAFVNDPVRQPSASPDLYLYQRMKTAYSASYSDESKWPLIEKELRSAGVRF
jgi:hypothetical protein